MDLLAPDDPREIGGYRLEGVLGSGGMGRVFFGRSPGGREVAVKVIRPELAADAAFRHRFVREVEAARQVGGFYSAPVVDAGLDADPPWVVTAFVPGPSLVDKVHAEGPLSPRSLNELGAGLAEGLQAIHSMGMVHRDLKPGNVIIGADGPRIIDFGIVWIEDATSITVSGGVLGTPNFMAPGQAEGASPCSADDIFSLGGVLCFAGTGRPPFGRGGDVLRRIRYEAPDLTGLGEPIRSVVAACLSKNPQDRPDAATLVRLLTAGDATGTTHGRFDMTRSDPTVHPRELAAQRYEAGDLIGAERAIRHWIELEPGSPAPFVPLCQVYEAASRWEDMLSAAERWRRLDPGDWRPVAWTASASFELEHWADAVTCYRRWLEHSPDEAGLWRSMWIAACHAGDEVAELAAAERWASVAADDAEAWTSYAQALFAAGRFEESVRAAVRSLSLVPDEVLALRVHADALSALQRGPEALAAYRRCAEQDPLDPDSWMHMWTAAVHYGDRQAGLRAAAGWTDAAPGNALAWCAYTRELMLAGRYAQAIEAAERGMAIGPGEDEAARSSENMLLNDYGVALTVTGRWDRLAGFIDRWPDSTDLTVLTMKAKALCELGRHSDAVDTATHVTVRDGSSAIAWEIMARSRHELGRHHEEVDAAGRWFALAPDNLKARSVYALALHETQQGDRLLPILDGWPGGARDPQVMSLRAQALSWLGRHAEAVPVAARLIELVQLAKLSGDANPDVGSAIGAFRVEAWSLYELGQYDGAAAAARQLVKHDPENSFHWFLLTRALIESKRHEEALKAAEQWIDVDPSGNAWSRKVRALLGLNRWEEARQGAELLLSLREDDPNALSLMTTACAGCGDERAIHFAERWVAAAPESPDAREMLDQLRAGR